MNITTARDQSEAISLKEIQVVGIMNDRVEFGGA